MKPGTVIKLLDGRVGTVVFRGLCGEGIKWGEHFPKPEDFDGTFGDIANPTNIKCPWKPDALLRKPWKDGQKEYDGMELVGDEYEVISEEAKP